MHNDCLEYIPVGFNYRLLGISHEYIKDNGAQLRREPLSHDASIRMVKTKKNADKTKTANSFGVCLRRIDRTHIRRW